MKKLHLLLTANDDDDCLLLSEPSDKIYDACTSYAVTDDGVKPPQMPELTTPPLLKIIFPNLNIQRKNGPKCTDPIGREPKTSDIPVGVLSTASNSDRVNGTYPQGANDFICKPQSFPLPKPTLAYVLSPDIGEHLLLRKREQFVINFA